MGAQVYIRFTHHIEAHAFPRIGVKGHCVNYRLRHHCFVKINAAPARPLLPHLPVGLVIRCGRVDSCILLFQPVNKFADKAGGDDFIALIDHVIEHQNHAARGHATQMVIAFQQCHRGAITRRRNGGSVASRASADHHDIAFCNDGQLLPFRLNKRGIAI